MFKRIEQKKKEIDEKRPLPKSTAASIKKDQLLRWIYNSNAIEGNSLTLSGTKVVLEDEIAVGGKTLREHFEVVNHREAIFYLEDIISKKEALSENKIKNMHYLILKNIDVKNAGVYRKEKVIISGASHTPPSPDQLKSEMEALINWYRNDSSKLHPVEKAAKLHTDFVNIHPFIDGNGRTARLLLNFELMKTGYPPAIIKVEEKGDYFDALDRAAVAGDYTDFIKIVREAVERSLDLYLQCLGV